MNDESIQVLDMTISAFSAIKDIKAEINAKRIRKNPKNDFIDGYNLAMFEALEIIDKHIESEVNKQ